jgi:hypothetical protein
MHNPTPLSTYTQAYKIARIARKKEQGNINIYPFRFHTQRESKEPPKNKTKKTPGRPYMQTNRDNMRIAGRHPSPSSRKEKKQRTNLIPSHQYQHTSQLNSDRLKPNINPLS